MSPMEEKKLKRSIEEAVVETLAEIKDRHGELAAQFDWDAYEGLDWQGLGKERNTEILYLKGHLTSFGNGFNFACKDEDYKEELVKVRQIVFKPATEASPDRKVSGALEGDTLTLVFDSLGGTVGPDDWEKGLKSAY
jgi:hypothetical protein